MTYKLSPSGRIFDGKGQEILPDDRDDAYLAYVLWLSGGRTPEQIEEPPAVLTPSERLALARQRGDELIAGFMAGALASGVNEAGLAGPLYRALAPIRQPLGDGALHAALDELDQLLKTPGQDRPAYPYTSDAALVPVRGAIIAAIEETT